METKHDLTVYNIKGFGKTGIYYIHNYRIRSNEKSTESLAHFSSIKK